MVKNFSADIDHKTRWGGLLEIPLIFKMVRSCVDYKCVFALKKILKSHLFDSLLEIGCGLGENVILKRGLYCGLDNSRSCIQYARRKYTECHFVVGDAVHLPFPSGAFDVSLLASVAHHLSDQEFYQTLLEMKRVTKKMMIIDDPIKTNRQSRISAFIYNLDRGKAFRTVDEIQKIFNSIPGISLFTTHSYRRFPGFYFHQVFVLTVDRSLESDFFN